MAKDEAKPAASPPLVVGFGDSLMAGYGVPIEKAFPVQLQNALAAQQIQVRIENQGISGDTTSDGLARIDWALRDDPAIIIVELGANDALRGMSPKLAAQNLDKILAKIKAHRRPDGSRIKIILAGMKAPRNLGADYVREFDAIYPHLAKKYHAWLYPFFLEGVAFHPELLQKDGLHPNAAGVAVMVKGFLPTLRKAVTQAKP